MLLSEYCLVLAEEHIHNEILKQEKIACHGANRSWKRNTKQSLGKHKKLSAQPCEKHYDG